MREIGVAKFGSRQRPHTIKWWAELGRIHYQDEDTGRYGSLSRAEFLVRLQALNDLNKQGKSVGGLYDIQERMRIARFVESGLELVRKAKQQGDPGDAQVVEARKDAAPKKFGLIARTSQPLPESRRRLILPGDMG